MKKVGLVLVSLLCVTTAFAGQGDGFLVLNGGSGVLWRGG